MAKAIIWKYENGNYFDGLDYIDRLDLDGVSIAGLPIFDISVEDIYGTLQYKPGEFDLSININTGERSVADSSIYDFFFATSDNKFLIRLKTDDSNGKKFIGTCTSTEREFDLVPMQINIRFKPIINELQAKMETEFVGELPGDVTYDYLLDHIADFAEHLNVTRSFSDYNTLVGGDNLRISSQVWNDMQGWRNETNTWKQFQELMIGSGLNYKVINDTEFIPTETYPHFVLYIFPLSSLETPTKTCLIIDAKAKTYFKSLQWLYISYKYINKDTHPSLDVNWKIEDGIAFKFSSVPIYYEADQIRNPTIISNGWFPFFSFTEITFGAAPSNTLYHYALPLVTQTTIGDIDLTLKVMDLPKYNVPTALLGIVGAVSGIRAMHGGTNWQQNDTFKPVMRFAMNQYMRYINNAKKQKEVLCIWDANHQYDIWDTVYLIEDGVQVNYWVNRVQNLNIVENTVELSLIEK